MAQYAEAGQTLVFLDWDDTLFPTSWLLEESGLEREEIPRSEQHPEFTDNAIQVFRIRRRA